MILNEGILEKKVEIKEIEEDLRVEGDQTHRMLEVCLLKRGRER
jgi:hypothetical protein